MGLELYEQFRKHTSVDSSKGDGNTIGSYRPMIVDRLLRNLKKTTSASRIDGWLDHVDPELTYYENKARLKEKTGATGFDSPSQSEREKWVSKMLDKQAEYEKRHEEKESKTSKSSTKASDSPTEPASDFGKWAIEHAEDRPRPGDAGEELYFRLRQERT